VSSETVAVGARASVSRWATRIDRLNKWLLHDLGGGPRPLKFAWVVNFQKAGTFPALGLTMLYYREQTPAATSTAAFVYLALHGAYGLVWLMKDLAFPDPNWQRRITLPSSLVTLLGLAVYWSFGWLLISGHAQARYPLDPRLWYCACITTCMVGCTVMIAADAQKYFTLRVRPGLITDGMFRFVRHPNYLGEMLIYTSLAALVWHWFPAIALACIWGGFFAVNMIVKETSLSRHPGWNEYKRRTWWLIPGLL
jgi:protein-S-isoprenylcysteine O-methyltransferase Ste14